MARAVETLVAATLYESRKQSFTMNLLDTNLTAIEEQFDVIIAGGGPAGSAAAIAAARAGCSVLVVDRGIHPRSKVCDAHARANPSHNFILTHDN